VFLSHAAWAGVPLVPGLDFAGIGKSGVYLFFVLSAFLLTRNALAAGAEAYGLAALTRYTAHRVLRIYPAFTAYLVFAVVATSLAGLVMEQPRVSPFLLDFEGLLKHLALLQGKGVTWSIAVEFKFYLLLPLVAWVLWRARRRGAGMLTAASLTLLVGSAVVSSISPQAVNDMSLSPYLLLFLSGAVLAAWTPWLRKVDSGMATWIGAGGLAGIILTVPSLYGWITGVATPGDRFHDNHLMFAALWSAVLFGCLAGRAALSAPFRTRAARAMGRISFSFYLWHVVAIAVAKAAAPMLGGAAGAIALAGGLALAAASYFAIERAGQRLARRMDRAAHAFPARLRRAET
jgi:peptidoglycan/LPS O-acetylase OafA/YrhL